MQLLSVCHPHLFVWPNCLYVRLLGSHKRILLKFCGHRVSTVVSVNTFLMPSHAAITSPLLPLWQKLNYGYTR